MLTDLTLAHMVSCDLLQRHNDVYDHVIWVPDHFLPLNDVNHLPIALLEAKIVNVEKLRTD